jgi:hypothetical protein
MPRSRNEIFAMHLLASGLAALWVYSLVGLWQDPYSIVHAANSLACIPLALHWRRTFPLDDGPYPFNYAGWGVVAGNIAAMALSSGSAALAASWLMSVCELPLWLPGLLRGWGYFIGGICGWLFYLWRLRAVRRGLV